MKDIPDLIHFYVPWNYTFRSTVLSSILQCLKRRQMLGYPRMSIAAIDWKDAILLRAGNKGKSYVKWWSNLRIQTYRGLSCSRLAFDLSSCKSGRVCAPTCLLNSYLVYNLSYRNFLLFNLFWLDKNKTKCL